MKWPLNPCPRRRMVWRRMTAATSEAYSAPGVVMTSADKISLARIRSSSVMSRTFLSVSYTHLT
ncbi:MAG: hypothetical protein Q3Y12_18365, partial [Phocaeicola sp.]|nr:hypothetical protein [Phocaeicola sp.]